MLRLSLLGIYTGTRMYDEIDAHKKKKNNSKWGKTKIFSINVSKIVFYTASGTYSSKGIMGIFRPGTMPFKGPHTGFNSFNFN